MLSGIKSELVNYFAMNETTNYEGHCIIYFIYFQHPCTVEVYILRELLKLIRCSEINFYPNAELD